MWLVCHMYTKWGVLECFQHYAALICLQHMVLYNCALIIDWLITNSNRIQNRLSSFQKQLTVMLGTCESAVCVRIEYESNWALQFKFKSNRPYIPLNTFHDGPMVAISIPPIQFVHCSSAGLPHMLCYITRVACCVCSLCRSVKNLPRLSMKKNKNQEEELEEAISAYIWMPTHSDTGNWEGEHCASWRTVYEEL